MTTTTRRPLDLRWTPPTLLLLAAVSLLGCDTALARDAAGDLFSHQYSCPDNRIAMKSVTLRGDEVFLRPAAPRELASDPERLAVWNKHTDEDLDQFQNLRYVNIVGCGVDRGYLCWQEVAGGSDGNIVNTVCPLTDAMTFGSHGKYTLRPEIWSTLKARAVR